jgi:hypothetical protein
MARQAGELTITGTIGDLTFYQTQDGKLVKRVSRVSSSVLKGPKYERAQEHWAEFGHSGKAVKLIRKTWHQVPQQFIDNRVTGRLSQVINKEIIQKEKFNPPGKRNMDDGDITPLKNFDCNIHAPLPSILHFDYTCTADRETGGMRIDFDNFIPAFDISPPPGATHFRIYSFAADLNFTEQQEVHSNIGTGAIPLNRTTVSGLSVIHLLPPESTNHRLLFLCIGFSRIVNGFEYVLNDKDFSAMRIVLVDGRSNGK